MNETNGGNDGNKYKKEIETQNDKMRKNYETA